MLVVGEGVPVILPKVSGIYFDFLSWNWSHQRLSFILKT